MAGIHFSLLIPAAKVGAQRAGDKHICLNEGGLSGASGIKRQVATDLHANRKPLHAIRTKTLRFRSPMVRTWHRAENRPHAEHVKSVFAAISYFHGHIRFHGHILFLRPYGQMTSGLLFNTIAPLGLIG